MDSKTARIRALNDELRQNFAGGVAVMTPGIAALDLSHIPSWCPDRFRRVLSLSPKLSQGILLPNDIRYRV
jgi:hypothetical protein